MCGLCAPRHWGHAALDDISVAANVLRSELAERALATSCWPPPTPAGSARAPVDERRAAALLADVDSPALAEAELSDRLAAVSAVQSELDAGEARAAAEAAAAFDEAVRGLSALREVALGGLRTAVAQRRSELAGERRRFETALAALSRLVGGLRAASQFLSPEQFAALYPALSAQVASALALAGELPEVRACVCACVRGQGVWVIGCECSGGGLV